MCWKRPSVSVYGKTICNQCDMTKRIFDREGVAYEYLNMEEDADAMAFVKDLGYKQAPVVIARYPNGSETHWSGFLPKKIMGYAQAAKSWGKDV